MSQFHQEALRRQHFIDSRHSKKKEISSSAHNESGFERQEATHSPSYGSSQPVPGSEYNHGRESTGSPSSHNTAHGSMNRSSPSVEGSLSQANRSIREREVVDPYFQNLKKKTKARVRNRFTSTDYLMQW